MRRAFGGMSRAPEIAPAAIGIGAGVAMVVPGSERILPHTLVDKHGNRCATQKWINRAFLVIVRGPGRPADAPPKLGLGGPKFRCYYPNSTPDDMRAILGSGSSGRWLNAWGQKSNYVAVLVLLTRARPLERILRASSVNSISSLLKEFSMATEAEKRKMPPRPHSAPHPRPASASLARKSSRPWPMSGQCTIARKGFLNRRHAPAEPDLHRHPALYNEVRMPMFNLPDHPRRFPRFATPTPTP